MSDQRRIAMPRRPDGMDESTAYLAGCMESLHDGQDRIETRLDGIVKVQADHAVRITALETRCDERGETCGRGMVISWRVAGVIVLSVLVAGALLGPDAVKAVAGVLR